jgi:signal transduction histidine kinase
VAGQNIRELTSEEPWAKAAELLAEARRTAAVVSGQACEEAFGRTWDLSVFPTPGGSGHEEAMVLVVRDITRMIKLQECLRRSETMAALGSLVAGVAHEVRNPLFSISATVDALKTDFAGQVEFDAHAQLLHSQVARLSRLMEDLLDYGKPPVLRLAEVGLKDVVRRAVLGCEVLARESRVTVEEEMPAGLPAVRLDADRIEQVIENLIANAIQQSQPGSTVRVAARLVGQGPELVVQFTVEDEGPGLPDVNAVRVFEPFFSRRSGGTGLGLSIVQRIVEAHGGQVTGANRPTGGAVFTVTLPSTGPREPRNRGCM